MQPHDRVNFGGFCFACSVLLSLASRCFSLSSVFPFITHRGRRIHPFARLLFRFMVQRTRHINVGVLVLLRFVSFPGLKNEAYTSGAPNGSVPQNICSSYKFLLAGRCGRSNSPWKESVAWKKDDSGRQRGFEV